MFIRLKNILISRCGFCFTSFITALDFVGMKFEGKLAKLVLNCREIRVGVGAQVDAEDGIGPIVACHVVLVKVGSTVDVYVLLLWLRCWYIFCDFECW